MPLTDADGRRVGRVALDAVSLADELHPEATLLVARVELTVVDGDRIEHVVCEGSGPGVDASQTR
jgi:hypothetical protein